VTEVRAQYALMYAQYAGSCACVRLHDSHSAKQYATGLQCCSPNLTHSTQRTDTVAHNAQVCSQHHCSQRHIGVCYCMTLRVKLIAKQCVVVRAHI
jgi:hypothetical protein